MTDTGVMEMPLAEALDKADLYGGAAGRGVPSASRTLAAAVRSLSAERDRLEARVRELLFQLTFWEARTDSHTAAFYGELRANREEWLRCLVDSEIRRRHDAMDKAAAQEQSL